MNTSTSHFDSSANSWDNPEKIQKSKLTAEKIKSALAKIDPNFRTSRLLEIGCGTGILGGNFITPDTFYTGIDSSSEMLKVLQTKFTSDKVKALNLDVETGDLKNLEYDFVISQMAFHHLKNPGAVVKNLKQNHPLKIAIIDLDKEDGSFHPDPQAMGVHHFGFSKNEIEQWAKDSDLKVEHYEIINIIEKNNKKYQQFLVILGQ